ncbi:putative uncharacterized protein DDB_G0274435 [Octopus sinensis]|uniref:Chitin-binding type-2 domain-containing protein n=1 Tax=Octopus sinensis TaxID=2607531 RepID=A0A6P7SAF1_9MOLL|nr:putative uncharacterized protein DDB_G0274435 [Octopus sinensis]
MTSLHKICHSPISQSTIMTSCMIIIAVLIRSSLSQFVCPEMFGMFQHPDNCDMFYVCNYGIPYQRTCPTGLLFDINLGVCRHSVQVHCFNETHQLTAGFTCPTPIGIYTDPTSCEHFYLCANGRGFRQKCPFGLIFDGVVCNWKKDNSCTPTWKSSLRDGINIDTKPNDPSRRSRVVSPKKSSEKLVPSTTDEHQRNQDGVSLLTSTEGNRITDEFERNRKQMRNKSDQSTEMGNLTENNQVQQQRKGNSNLERSREEEKTVIGKAKVKNVEKAEEEGKENNENDGNKARGRYLKEYLAREEKRRKFLKELEKKRSELWERQQQLRRKLLRQHQLQQRKLFILRQKQQQQLLQQRQQLQQLQEKKEDQQQQHQNGSVPQFQQHEGHKQHQDQQQQPQQKEEEEQQQQLQKEQQQLQKEQQQLQKEQQLLENEEHQRQQHQQEKQEQSTARDRNLKANEIRDIWSESDQSNSSKTAWKPNSSKGRSHSEKGLYPSLFHSSVSNQIFLVNHRIKPNYTNDNMDDGAIVKDSQSSNSNASESNNNNINSNGFNKAVTSGNAR